MIHILVGDMAAAQLQQAFELDENLRGEIIVLKDTLGIGPILPSEGQMFHQLRTQFWQLIDSTFDGNVVVPDEHTIKLLAVKAQREEEPVCLWLAPCVSDVCAYYWLLPLFAKFPGMLHTINIIGLPFLNEKGQLFYPNNFSQVPPKEFMKTKRLLKEVTPAEYEVEVDEWLRLQQDNQWVRIYEGGKKIVSKDVTFYDQLILNNLSDEFQKASKVLHETMKKITQTISHIFIEWRIKSLIHEGRIAVQGDVSKTLKEFEIKKISSPTASQDNAPI